MRFDIDDIEKRVEEKKKSLYKTLILCASLVALSVALIIVYPETTVVFLCFVIIIFSLYLAISRLKSSEITVLFSHGVIGKNVKEHEYVTAGTRMTRYGGISYRYIPSRHKGDVYILRDDGEISVISHLNKVHLDLYEIGDTLTVYPGTKYPTVTGRPTDRNPCPICGNMVNSGEDACSVCGLKTVKKA